MFSFYVTHVFSEWLRNSPGRPYYYWYHLCFYIIIIITIITVWLEYLKYWNPPELPAKAGANRKVSIGTQPEASEGLEKCKTFSTEYVAFEA